MDRPKIYGVNSDVETPGGIRESFKYLLAGKLGDDERYDPESAVVDKYTEDEIVVTVTYRRRRR